MSCAKAEEFSQKILDVNMMKLLLRNESMRHQILSCAIYSVLNLEGPNFPGGVAPSTFTPRLNTYLVFGIRGNIAIFFQNVGAWKHAYRWHNTPWNVIPSGAVPSGWKVPNQTIYDKLCIKIWQTLKYILHYSTVPCTITCSRYPAVSILRNVIS